MSMIETEGDLLYNFRQGKYKAIVHGCNCFHTMGSGIAGQIHMEFPEVMIADRQTKRGDSAKLGKVTMAETKFGYIVNMYTQYLPGREDPLVLQHAIGQGFALLNEHCDVGDKIGIPLIGCGIAGGKWDVIKPIIYRNAPKLDIEVVHYKPGCLR